jgi:hypothetical protein
MQLAVHTLKDFYSEGGWEITFYLNHNNGVLLNQTLKLAIENKEKIDALQLVTWNDFEKNHV